MAPPILRSAVVGWPLGALLLPLLPLLVLLLSLQLPRERQLLLLIGDGPVESQPFHLQDGWWGSPRLDLRVELPPNSSLLLDVDLLDGAGQPVLQLSKEGWREQGTWSEEGESGTYDEQDDALTLNLRPRQSGVYRLRLQHQDLLDGAGVPLADPLQVRLSVENHSVDRPLLLITALVAAVLVSMLWRVVYGDCRLRVHRRSDEATACERLILGAPGLLRLQVEARYEEPFHPPAGAGAPPDGLTLELSLTDALGRALLQERQPLRLRPVAGSDDEGWTASARWHLQLDEPRSVRVRVALPQELAKGALELEWLDLLVEDGVVTPWPINARALAPPPATQRA
ncbi:hypothetical protein [Cyanobium sp. Morenito 9A2]|uniref:hypothetical protein n=1 Tax=Cyanobium sp. Morenito 9A2 TaxID=2823718 RepID=UPI0020CC7F55|nr:hypothetical protein [Cyanobium sp. Morenito 9A2]MCP9848921.1 hypothetical protein [Cyanobium sp. Morenito 9A2]